METLLNDGWCLYFHDPNDTKWEKDGTQMITTIQSLEDYVAIAKEMKDMWNKGMFFIMREHILPEWEDENCKDGGIISFKIMKPDVSRVWYELSCKALGETLLKKPHDGWNQICGISISPKRNYCILRIWVSKPIWGDINLYNLQLPNYSNVMFRKHLDETNTT